MKGTIKSRPYVSKEKSSNIYKNLYRHFKGEWYELLGTCKHSEKSDEEFILYKTLYDCPEKNISRGDMYVRPIEMFFSETDKEKYPEANQEYRFMNYYELVDCFGKKTVDDIIKGKKIFF